VFFIFSCRRRLRAAFCFPHIKVVNKVHDYVRI
jgi:hypothetical protein